MEREELSSSIWYPGPGHVGMDPSCTRASLDWTLESISLPRGCQTLEQAFQSSGWCPEPVSAWDIWTMPLAAHINLVIPESLRWSLQVPCNWNNLFYSMLSHSGTLCNMKITQGVWITWQKQISKTAVDNLQVNVSFTITLVHLLRNPLLPTAKESLSNS